MKTKQEKQTKERLPHYWRRTMSWTAYLASNGAQALIIGYLSFYLTENIYMSAAVVGTILALSRVFDGFSDIIAGFIIDKTNSRWGKARPYSVLTLVMWLAVVLLFTVPDISNFGKIVYVFIMYNLSDSVARTMLFASESVHYKRGFTNDEQLDIVGISGLLAGVMNIIINIFMPILISRLGDTNKGWTIIAIVFAIPCAVMGLLKLFFVPEVDVKNLIEEKKKHHITMKIAIKALFHNKYIFIFEGALLSFLIISGMSMSTYYFRYVVGDLEKLSIVSMMGLVAMLLMPFIPVLTRKMGIRAFAALSLVLGGMAYLILYLNPTNLLLLSICAAVNLLAGLPISMLMNIVAIQCMKYSEWKEGIQIEGLIASMNGVSQKVGRALGAILVGFLLSASGYSGSLTTQPESATSMIKFLYIGLPCILTFIAAAFVWFYTLEDKMPQIEADLKARIK